ncbi:hypothetical protein CEXT_168891 [Caerostris extrusa]|uniref:Uncharacterized protein n=1 Tax=Caerostris extrusa TaxID=172846 RepID=A0AAV4PAL9_CAEEX|nr:hypothetical protein CEXT_168891 [Caerostris extrusa]
MNYFKTILSLVQEKKKEKKKKKKKIAVHFLGPMLFQRVQLADPPPLTMKCPKGPVALGSTPVLIQTQAPLSLWIHSYVTRAQLPTFGDLSPTFREYFLFK